MCRWACLLGAIAVVHRLSMPSPPALLTCPAHLAPSLPQAHLELKNFDAAIMDFNKVAELDDSYPGAPVLGRLAAWDAKQWACEKMGQQREVRAC